MRRIYFLFAFVIFFGYFNIQKSFAAETSVTPTPTTGTQGLQNPTLLPSISPISPPYPTADPKESKQSCDDINKGTVYPPNGECYSKVSKVETDIEKYPLTCVSPPTIDYRETFIGNVAPLVVDVIVTHDLQNAQLGGFGPSLDALSTSTNMDDIAKQYLFNGLFDKPFYKKDDTPREAFRTYWRFLTAVEQANFKADFLGKINKSINNTYWNYVDNGGSQHEANAKALKKSLPPCLVSFPVCSTFYAEYLNLSQDLKDQYDTLLPYNFDSTRGFLVVKKQISRENVSYLNAILSGSVGNLGLLPSYTPSAFVKSPDEFQTTTDEKTLDPKVIEAGTITECPTPQKVSSLPAPKTYPNGKTLTQVVRIKLAAKEISSTSSSCSCNSTACTNVYCDGFSDETSCSKYNCSWTGGTKTYELSGQGAGDPIGILNSPKVTSITDSIIGNAKAKIPSFFKMMIPDFAKVPDKVTISASGISASANTPNTSIGGSNIIYRENNLAQDAMHLLQNCWLVPGDQQKSSKCGNKKPTTALCKGEAFKKIEPNPQAPSSVAEGFFTSIILPRLTPDLVSAYAEAEKATGVPCEVLAGIHYEEGDNDPTRNLQNGGPLKGSLADSAKAAATELLGKAGGSIPDLNTLMKALSYYNGGGNANCQASASYDCTMTKNDKCGASKACDNATTNTEAIASCKCGAVETGSCRGSCSADNFPWKFEYPYCPPPTTGYDDPYVTNWWKSPEHDSMYLLFKYDCTMTKPFIHNRPGSLTVAISMFLQESK